MQDEEERKEGVGSGGPVDRRTSFLRPSRLPGRVPSGVVAESTSPGTTYETTPDAPLSSTLYLATEAFSFSKVVVDFCSFLCSRKTHTPLPLI